MPKPIIVALFVIPGVAAAQPAPGAGSAAPPAAPATTEPAPPPTGPVTTPEHPPEEKKADDKSVGAKYDGGLKLETADGSYELKLQFRNQLRFEATRPLDGPNQFLDRFYINRMRLQAEGHVFGDVNRYKLEFAFTDQGQFSYLKDLFIDRKLAEAPVWLRMGQWKRPFNRAEMVSDFSSTFNERSIENDLAGGGRDIGVALHNDYEKSPEGLEWVAGVFNQFNGGKDRPDLAGAVSTTCTTNPMTGVVTCKDTRPSTFPTDFGPTFVARVGLNSANMKGYSESDLEGGPFRYAVALAYKLDLANFAKQKESSWPNNLSHGLELDTLIKVEGFQTHLGAVLMKLKSAKPLYGMFVQPGLFIVPKKAEVAARFAYNTGDAVDPTRGQIEARGAFTWFFHGHAYKLASDFGFLQRLGEDAMMVADKPDLQLRVMMQLSI